MAHAATHHKEGNHHHIIPMKVLIRVFGGLIFLTVLTVLTATQLDLGAFNVPLALAIAFTKAGLVLAFFMALKYDNRVNTLTFVVGAFFVLVFLVFTLFDTAFRGDIGNVDALTVQDRTRLEEEAMAREPGSAGTQPAAVPDTTATAPADTTAASASDTTATEAAAPDSVEAQ